MPRPLRFLCLMLCLMPATLHAMAQQSASPDETAVRAAAARETEGWTKFDAKQIASMYTADAVWQNPFGVRLHSSAQLEKFLNNLFARPGYRSATDTAPAKVLDLRLTSPTSAVVWLDEASKGQIDDATGKSMQPRHSYYMEVFVKKDGEWKISDCLIMDVLH